MNGLAGGPLRFSPRENKTAEMKIKPWPYKPFCLQPLQSWLSAEKLVICGSYISISRNKRVSASRRKKPLKYY